MSFQPKQKSQTSKKVKFNQYFNQSFINENDKKNLTGYVEQLVILTTFLVHVYGAFILLYLTFLFSQWQPLDQQFKHMQQVN